MKHKTESITHDDISYMVMYKYEIEKGYYSVPENIASWVEPTVEVWLIGVSTVLLDELTNILHLLNQNQINLIKSKLTY
jgi:hypothetical protein